MIKPLPNYKMKPAPTIIKSKCDRMRELESYIISMNARWRIVLATHFVLNHEHYKSYNIFLHFPIVGIHIISSKMAVKISTISVILILALLSFGHCCYGELRRGFYNKACPNVENIVFKLVQEGFNKNPSIAPAMIRLYFHDCFSNVS